MNPREWPTKWLVAGMIVFVGGVVVVTSLVTLYWSGTLERTAEHVTSSWEQVDAYDFPNHGGRFRARTEDDGIETMSTLETRYDVDIRGRLATVSLHQRFENRGAAADSAMYELPLHPSAAVHEMEMQVGDRTIEAVVRKKEEARETYERAKRRGDRAALLEQERPNLFTQRVANMPGGEVVEVEITYVQPLPKEEGYYRFSLPLVVGERHAPKGGAEEETKREKTETLSPDRVDIELRLDGGGVPLEDVGSPSHTLDGESRGNDGWSGQLAASSDVPNRHFRFHYRLAGEETTAGVVSHWDDDRERGYFSLRLQPPGRVPVNEQKREVVFVIDRSGSMEGEPLERTKEFVMRAMERLTPQDRFRVVLFSEDAVGFSDEALPATRENLEEAVTYVGNLTAEGGTAIGAGVERALAGEAPDGVQRMVAFATDGQVENEWEVVRTLREEVGDARVMALGVGGDRNTYLLEEMGRAGRGMTRVLTSRSSNNDLIEDLLFRFRGPVLSDISIEWGAREPGGVVPGRIPDLYAGESVELLGTFEETGTYEATVSGERAGETVELPVTLDLSSSEKGEAVKLIWARERIADHMHDWMGPEEASPDVAKDELKGKIRALGLEYGLTTQWTSLVAVERRHESDDKASEARDSEAGDSADDEDPGGAEAESEREGGERTVGEDERASNRDVSEGLPVFPPPGGAESLGGECDESGGVGCGGEASERRAERGDEGVEETLEGAPESKGEPSIIDVNDRDEGDSEPESPSPSGGAASSGAHRDSSDVPDREKLVDLFESDSSGKGGREESETEESKSDDSWFDRMFAELGDELETCSVVDVVAPGEGDADVKLAFENGTVLAVGPVAGGADRWGAHQETLACIRETLVGWSIDRGVRGVKKRIGLEFDSSIDWSESSER